MGVFFRNATQVAINSNPLTVEMSEIQNFINSMESRLETDLFPNMTLKKIVWVVPQASEFGGGFRTLSRFLKKFNDLGIVQEIHVYQPIHPVDLQFQSRIWHEVFGVPKNILVFQSQNVSNRGAFVFATGWQTIFHVLNTVPRNRRGWFQQDEESLFHIPGAFSDLIERSYQEFDYAITAGPWLATQAIKKGISEANFFKFGCDEIYFSNARVNSTRARTIVAYFQAAKPWRGSLYINEVLKEVISERPNWKVQLVGDEYARNLTLPKNFSATGVLTPVELSYVYAESSIGVCISLSNASLVPYEMISAGLQVLTNSGENNSWLAEPGTSNLRFEDLEYLKFKKALINLIDEIEEGMEFYPNQIPTWNEILDQFVLELKSNPTGSGFNNFFIKGICATNNF
jgi:glycosyltransferase involved in cell wall biosynthesis